MTRFIPIAGISPLEMWKIDANIIIMASPAAANGVSMGLIRKREGKIKPKPPSNSLLADKAH